MRLLFMIVFALSLALLSGCADDGKPAVNEDFSDLSGLDEKADAFSYRLKLLETLEDGDSNKALYKATPRFRGYDFFAQAGDQVDIWVRSTQGDALTWLLDSRFGVIATNDDADGATFDSHLKAVLPSSRAGRYFIVMRDYNLESHYFTTSLSHSQGPGAGTDAAWQALAMQTANQMVLELDSLAPFEIDVATLPAAGQTRAAVSAAKMGVPTAYKLDIDGRDCYLVYASGFGGVSVADLIDDSGLWFAHGYGPEADVDLLWSLFQSDHTLCNCGSGMPVCTWLDGTVSASSDIYCD